MSDPDPTARPTFRSAPAWPSPSGTPVQAVPAARWAALTADLRARGVTDEPTVVAATRVVWNDGSLGCPSPGHAYTQALVDGMRVVVTAGGRTYDYRFGSDDIPVLCTR